MQTAAGDFTPIASQKEAKSGKYEKNSQEIISISREIKTISREMETISQEIEIISHEFFCTLRKFGNKSFIINY